MMEPGHHLQLVIPVVLRAAAAAPEAEQRRWEWTGEWLRDCFDEHPGSTIAGLVRFGRDVDINGLGSGGWARFIAILHSVPTAGEKAVVQAALKRGDDEVPPRS